LVYLDNLVDLIVKSIDHPAAANQTFLVSDGEDLSTTQLVKRLSKALGKPARLIPLPVFLLKLGALMFGKSKIAQNLCGSLQVDIAKTQQLLGWNPPISVEEGLRCTAAHWAVSHRKDPTISGRGSWIIKRVFDLLLGLTATLLLALPLLVISGLVRLTSKGPILYWSDRVGRNNVIFRMPKFRSMRIGTPVVATHLLQDPNTYLTPIGSFLRKSSMDELPQLWSILKGDLSFVGPRPALFNQADLIALRTEQGVHLLMPGLTGWAQVNGRDELPIPEKVKLDVEYLHRRSFWFDLQILWLTGAKVFSRDGVSH
jgi:O-antigen biosynthesis protein WbqP